MASLAGVIGPLGDPQTQNIVAQFTGRNQFVSTIDNSAGFDTLLIENRSSGPIVIQPRQAGLSGGSAGVGQPVSGGITIPGLTIAQVPIDPEADVLVSIALNSRLMIDTRVAGVAHIVESVGGAYPRSMPFLLLDCGGGLHMTELYPLRSCLVSTQRHLIGAGATQVDLALDTANLIGSVSAVLMQGTPPGSNIPYGTKRTLFPQAPDPDTCIVALQVALEALGASSQAIDLACTVGPIPNNGSNVGQADIQLFGNSAVAATGLLAPSGIIPVPGVSQVIWTNVGTSNVTFRVTYWIGVPSDPPSG